MSEGQYQHEGRKRVKAQPIPIDPARQEQLIRDRVIEDPNRPWPGEAQLVESGIPVWAIIGYLRVANWSVPLAATGYDVSEEEILAAVAFYYRYRGAIDAKLEANEYAALHAV